MLISQYQGVIKIPMFASGQVFNFAGYPPGFALFNFDNVSPMPILINQATTPSQFVLQQMQSELMAVFGLSKLELGPTGGHAINTGNITNVDGYDVFYGAQGATLDPTVYFNTIGIKAHPRPTGTYSTAGIFLTQFTGTRQSTLYQPFPMNNNFLPVIGGFWTDLSFDIKPLTIAAPSGAVTVIPGSISDGSGNTGFLLSGADFIACRIPATYSPVYDNGFYLSCTSGVHAHGVKYCIWSSFALSLGRFVLDDLSLNNATLNAIWQTPTKTRSYAYYGGYIHCLNTAGAGPSGNPWEYVLMSPDFKSWWLIQMLPQDAATAAALGRMTSPSLKIDSEGIVWYNSGAVADLNTVYYSYSPTPYFIPVPYIGNLQPFQLPCFNVCSPVTQIP